MAEPPLNRPLHSRTTPIIVPESVARARSTSKDSSGLYLPHRRREYEMSTRPGRRDCLRELFPFLLEAEVPLYVLGRPEACTDLRRLLSLAFKAKTAKLSDAEWTELGAICDPRTARLEQNYHDYAIKSFDSAGPKEEFRMNREKLASAKAISKRVMFMPDDVLVDVVPKFDLLMLVKQLQATRLEESKADPSAAKGGEDERDSGSEGAEQGYDMFSPDKLGIDDWTRANERSNWYQMIIAALSAAALRKDLFRRMIQGFSEKDFKKTLECHIIFGFLVRHGGNSFASWVADQPDQLTALLAVSQWLYALQFTMNMPMKETKVGRVTVVESDPLPELELLRFWAPYTALLVIRDSFAMRRLALKDAAARLFPHFSWLANWIFKVVELQRVAIPKNPPVPVEITRVEIYDLGLLAANLAKHGGGGGRDSEYWLSITRFDDNVPAWEGGNAGDWKARLDAFRERFKAEEIRDFCFSTRCGRQHGHRKDFKQCSKCKQATYCSDECQREDWQAFHKLVCKA